jgi:hypothetical protein
MNITADNPREWSELNLATRRGHRAVILNVLAPPNKLIGGRTVVAMYQTSEGEWALNAWFANGHFYPNEREDQLDLITVR